MRHARGVVLLIVCLFAAPVLAPSASGAEANAGVLFDDQHTSGSIVIVDLVQLPQGGFVGVHDQTNAEAGELGELAGASIVLGAGMHSNVPVTLETEVKEPRTLVAAIYQDANGNGALDQGVDHHDGHDHDHGDGEVDPPYRSGDRLIGDAARVEPYSMEETVPSSIDPLLSGAAAAALAVLFWAVRFR